MPVNVTVMKQRNKNAIKFEFEYSSFSCEETSGSSLFEPLKILTRKNSVFGHFSRSANYLRYGYKKKCLLIVEIVETVDRNFSGRPIGSPTVFSLLDKFKTKKEIC